MESGQETSYWVLGDLNTFKTVSKDTNGSYFLMEMVIYPQTGSPRHIRSREDESFLVQSGEIQFKLRNRPL